MGDRPIAVFITTLKQRSAFEQFATDIRRKRGVTQTSDLDELAELNACIKRALADPTANANIERVSRMYVVDLTPQALPLPIFVSTRRRGTETESGAWAIYRELFGCRKAYPERSGSEQVEHFKHCLITENLVGLLNLSVSQVNKIWDDYIALNPIVYTLRGARDRGRPPAHLDEVADVVINRLLDLTFPVHIAQSDFSEILLSTAIAKHVTNDLLYVPERAKAQLLREKVQKIIEANNAHRAGKSRWWSPSSELEKALALHAALTPADYGNFIAQKPFKWLKGGEELSCRDAAKCLGLVRQIFEARKPGDLDTVGEMLRGWLQPDRAPNVTRCCFTADLLGLDYDFDVPRFAKAMLEHVQPADSWQVASDDADGAQATKKSVAAKSAGMTAASFSGDPIYHCYLISNGALKTICNDLDLPNLGFQTFSKFVRKRWLKTGKLLDTVQLDGREIAYLIGDGHMWPMFVEVGKDDGVWLGGGGEDEGYAGHFSRRHAQRKAAEPRPNLIEQVPDAAADVMRHSELFELLDGFDFESRMLRFRRRVERPSGSGIWKDAYYDMKVGAIINAGNLGLYAVGACLEVIMDGRVAIHQSAGDGSLDGTVSAEDRYALRLRKGAIEDFSAGPPIRALPKRLVDELSRILEDLRPNYALMSSGNTDYPIRLRARISESPRIIDADEGSRTLFGHYSHCMNERYARGLEVQHMPPRDDIVSYDEDTGIYEDSRFIGKWEIARFLRENSEFILNAEAEYIDMDELNRRRDGNEEGRRHLIWSNPQNGEFGWGLGWTQVRLLNAYMAQADAGRLDACYDIDVAPLEGFAERPGKRVTLREKDSTATTGGDHIDIPSDARW